MTCNSAAGRTRAMDAPLDVLVDVGIPIYVYTSSACALGDQNRLECTPGPRARSSLAKIDVVCLALWRTLITPHPTT